MKMTRNLLALILALSLLFSTVGAAFATAAAETARSEEATGFLSEYYRDLDVYAKSDIVRAVILTEGGNDAVYAQMKGIDYDLKFEYETLFGGFSCDVAYGEFERIAGLEGVTSVHIANSYAEPEPEKTNRMPSANVMTGNSAASASGYDGKRIVVAVLDTGLNTTHEAFQDSLSLCAQNAKLTKSSVNSLKSKLYGAGTYLNAKVPFAYDYADGDTDVTDKNGHGTHVSGTVAGYVGTKTADGGIDYEFVGGSPYAQLLSMKVFKNAGGGTSSDVYFKALEDAYILGADVINMSLGSQNGFTYDAGLEQAVFGNIYQKMVNAGIIMSIAAGNEYSMANYANGGVIGADYTDYGTVASPSTYEGNVSVASVENTNYPATVIQVDGKNLTYVDSSTNAEDRWVNNFGDTTAPYVLITDAEGNLAYGLPEDYVGKGVTGKIAVVSRGTLSFEEKVEYAENAGAIGCIVVNNTAGSISMVIDTYEIPAISVELSALDTLMNASVKRVTSPSGRVTLENPDAWKMSDFSNWGTTPMLTLDPTVTSVGGDIYSTDIGATDAYSVKSGTSMATPNASATYANVLAMIYAENPSMSKYTAAELAKALMYSTATILPGDNGLPYSPRKQGAGLASAEASIYAYQNGAYIVDPIKEPGDDEDQTGRYSFTFTVRNESDRQVTYTELGATVLTDQIGDTDEMRNLLCAAEVEHTVTFSANGRQISEVSIAPGKSVDITATVTLSAQAKSELEATFENGCYIEGFITLGDIHATFMTYYGDWTKAPIFETVDFTDIAETNYYLKTALADVMGNTYAELGYTYADWLSFVARPNLAYITNSDYSKAYAYAGDNMLDVVPYYDQHIAISTPNTDAASHYAEAIYITPYLLRNAKSVSIRITNKSSGEVYYSATNNYVPKSVYDTTNATWTTRCQYVWNGTNSSGSYVPSGTVANVSISAYLPYGGGAHTWGFDVTVDGTAPTVGQTIYNAADETLTVVASDENYLQAIFVADTSGNIIGQEAVSSDVKGQSFRATFDVTGQTSVYVGCLDYATNETAKQITLSQVAQAATVKLVTPNGEQTHNSYIGESFTFPTMEDFGSYSFVGWATQRIDSASSLSDITYYAGGSSVSVSSAKNTFYTLYAQVDSSPREKALYQHEQGDDYEGTWAICGWNYTNSNFQAKDPYALDENGQKVQVAAISDATVSTQNLEFETNDLSIRYRISKTSDGSYTIQNVSTGRYLATNSALDILYLNTVTSYAKWKIVKSSNNTYNTTIINVGNSNAAFVYDDEQQSFAIHDNSKFYTGSAYPSEWFYTLLYRCSEVVQTVKGYTFGAHEHIYVGEVTTPSTCIKEGVMTYTCSVCADSYDEPIPVGEHTEVITPAVAPTCEKKGLSEGRHCSVCNEVLLAQTEIDALGHSYEGVITEPTCDGRGYTEYTCEVCGKSYISDYVDALGHSYEGVITEPTCDGRGYTEYTCETCGKSYISDYVDAVGHTVVVKVGVAPTCTQKGLSDGEYCCVCNKVLSEQTVLEALGHSYEVSVVEPTCTAVGYTSYVCENCDYSYVTNRISATGHSYVSVVTPPTCEKAGYTTYTCTSCGNSYVSDRVSATGHQYTAVVTPPTCDKAGYTTNVCSVCGSSYVSNHVPMLSHEFTYYNNGENHMVGCKNCAYYAQEAHSFADCACICGAVQNKEPQFDENLKFSMNISVGAAMTVNYNVMASAVSKYADFYLQVSKQNADGEATVVTYGIGGDREQMGNMANVIYNATFEGISAKEMGDEFATTLYAVDEVGNLYYGNTETQSIGNFLYSRFDIPNASDELKTMAADMLLYGAAAQARFDYATDRLVTANLTAEQIRYATRGISDATDICTSSGAGANVSCVVTVGSKVELGLSVFKTGLSNPENVRCEIRDAQGELLAEPEVSNSSNIIFVANYADVGAREMRKPITATFYMGETAISQSITWSVESYVAQVRAKSGVSETELNMVNAMLSYGDSVGAYLTSMGQ